MSIKDSTLTGAAGGQGGSVTYTGSSSGSKTNGTGGAGGHGGGSVFGGVSTGGSGSSHSDQSGDTAGETSNNRVTLVNTILDGSQAAGGNGGKTDQGAGGSGGHGGGSVFGGLSTGGAGGNSGATALGGAGGNASNNTVTLNTVTLKGGTAGSGGTSKDGINGINGLAGGSVFGGVSYGGGGGIASNGMASGGNAGNASSNKVSIDGNSTIPQDIYGGYSQGGAKGIGATAGNGQGGLSENNTVTLIGSNLTIGGSIYGGYSADGDGTVNAANSFSGNTLVLRSYQGTIGGTIKNFENYYWGLPVNVANGDTIIQVTGAAVDLNNTKHTIAVVYDGQRFNVGDTVVLLDKVTGTPASETTVVDEGFFLTYDAIFGVVGDDLVVTITGSHGGSTAGRLNERAKALLEGRAAAMAFVNQGADLISDYGIDAARVSGRTTNLFVVADGGSNRYETGSHIRIRNTKIALGMVCINRIQAW